MVDGSGIHRNGIWVRPKHSESEENYAGFEEVLRRFLPPSLQFERLEFRDDELVFVCQNGSEQFILETASGGVTTLISLAWMLYNFSSQSKEFTLIIDEIENHLHPLLQREILRTIRDVFPFAKIIATTHSPLVVNSVKDARVYALKPNERNRIESVELPIRDKTATANRILDDILGVSAPYPAWAEEEIDEILLNFKSRPFNDENAKLLLEELKKRGLGDLVNAALGKWLDDKITRPVCPHPRALENKNYKHQLNKDALRDASHGKCMYCESNIDATYAGDVEHILPKDKNAYPELEFTWENLGYVCWRCNNIKSNKFDRNYPFINPYVDAPENHFVAQGHIVFPRLGDQRAEGTIEAIELNRDELLGARLDAIYHLKSAAEAANAADSELVRVARLKVLKGLATPNAQYSFCCLPILEGYLSDLE